MEGKAFAAGILAGFDGEFELSKLRYDQETSKFDLDAYLDCSPTNASNVLDCIRENLGEQFVRQSTKQCQFWHTDVYTCHCSKPKAKGVKVTKKTACSASVNLSYYDKHKAQNKKGNEAAIARNAPFMCLLRLHSNHNHPLGGQHLMKLSASPQLKQQFLEYFAARNGPADALHENEARLRADPGFQLNWLTDGRQHPTYHQVHYWHSAWRQSVYGGFSDADVRQELLKRQVTLAAKGIRLSVSRTGTAVAMVTPLAERIHMQSFAAGQCYCDSTGACDRTSATVTTLSTQIPENRITAPIGLIITEGKSREHYDEGLALLDDALSLCPVKWGGVVQPGQHSLGPSHIMTDHDAGEMAALSAAFPGTILQLCCVHILKAVWRNIADGKHSLSGDQKAHYFHSFKALLYEQDLSKFEHGWDEYVDAFRRDGHLGLFHYFDKVLCGEEHMWALCYRDYTTRHNDSNNISEKAVQVIDQF
jgi:hypothetical protein